MSEQELLVALKSTISESMNELRVEFKEELKSNRNFMNESMNELRRELKETVAPIHASIVELRTEVVELRTEVGELRTEVVELRTEVGELRTEVGELRTEVGELRTEVGRVELTLENETNRNIRIIAEGHSNLNRRLDDAIRAESSIELTRVRMNVLESDVSRLKDAIQMLQRPLALNI